MQLARVFAQLWDVENGLVLVDEPLASLDPGLQFDLLQSIDHFAGQRNHGVLAVLHDINHALLSFARLLLIKEGGLTADVPADAAALPHLESLYGIGLRCVSDEGGSLVIPVRRPHFRERS
ncbi:MAG: hypothetical protein ACOY4D_13750 [Pseudomonadota bacterium]